jgi:iron complex outermembrane receptor protein
MRPFFAGEITVGLEGDIDIRNFLTDYDVSPVHVEYLKTSHPDRSLALFLQDEKKLSKRWTLDVGLRIDKAHYHSGGFASPRAALIHQRAEWTYKFLYGRSFRAPSAFQLFYGDGIADAANPTLRPEWADTVEVDAERKLGKRMNLQTSAYGYELHNILLGVYLPNGLLQYQNSALIRAAGLEVEINGRPTNWLEATASYALQQARDDTALENSPRHLAKLRFAVPLGRKFDLSSGMQYESSRWTLAGNSLQPVYLADFTLTSKRLLRDLDIRLGVRNAFNSSYSDPIALNPAVDSMPQPGRTFFVELIAHQAR